MNSPLISISYASKLWNPEALGCLIPWHAPSWCTPGDPVCLTRQSWAWKMRDKMDFGRARATEFFSGGSRTHIPPALAWHINISILCTLMNNHSHFYLFFFQVSRRVCAWGKMCLDILIRLPWGGDKHKSEGADSPPGHFASRKTHCDVSSWTVKAFQFSINQEIF